jgi:hypothetical protein
MLNVRVVAVGAVGSTALVLPGLHPPESNPITRFDCDLAEFAMDLAILERNQLWDARHAYAADSAARAHAAGFEDEAVRSFSTRLFLGSLMQIPLWPLKGGACAAYEEAEHSMEPFPLRGSDENEVSSHSTRRMPHVPKDCLLAHALVSAATGLANMRRVAFCLLLA